jgi:CHAD domain-containing protein
VISLLHSESQSAVLPEFASFPSLPASHEPNGCTAANHGEFPEGWPLSTEVGPFLANSLRNRWESYRGQLRSCQAKFSEEAVHELRVATRRLMAQIVMLGCIAPAKAADNARMLLKRRLKALGELRDTHVQRLFIEKQMSRFPELIFVRDFLQRQERRLERSAAEKVKDFKIRKLEKWVSRLSEYLVKCGAEPADAARLSTEVVQAANQAFAEVVRRRQAIEPGRPSTVHRTRIAFKKFRYMVEALSPDLTGLTKGNMRALARYQKRMGILQDLEVMQQCIQDFAQQHEGMKTLLESFNRYLQSRRARSLRSFLESADDLFQFWPPGLTRINGHMAIVSETPAVVESTAGPTAAFA